MLSALAGYLVIRSRVITLTGLIRLPWPWPVNRMQCVTDGGFLITICISMLIEGYNDLHDQLTLQGVARSA